MPLTHLSRSFPVLPQCLAWKILLERKTIREAALDRVEDLAHLVVDQDREDQVQAEDQEEEAAS